MASNNDPYLLVAAIDFGTTFSGYAFSFVSSEKDPSRHEKIRINKSWGASMGFQSYKAPTSVLTTKTGEFLEFGYEAEKTYTEALEEEDSDDEEETKKPDMLLFRHFKMMLHKEKAVKLDHTIAAVDGTIHRAVTIFAHAIRYLKDHMLKAIKLETGVLPNESEIRWVVTVPAIWGEASKQFMREAAHKAGCIKERSSKKLVITLEPEAASMCCRSLNLAQYADATDVGFPMGTKYLVLDCGGGTIDITAHEVGFDKKIKEIVEASGGPWGGTAVDRKFREFLDDALGKHFMNMYVKKCPNEWLQFLTYFERAKKAFNPDPSSKINIPIPLQMANLFSSMNAGKTITKALKGNQGAKCSSGMLSIQHDLAHSFFDEATSHISKHLKKLMRNSKLAGIKYILMVGGFSECHILQNVIKTHFGKNGTNVLIPSEAQMAIIKGAVLYGHRPESISERVLRYTYGCAMAMPFDATKHDVNKKFHGTDGIERCQDIFSMLTEKGSVIKYKAMKTETYDSIKGGKSITFRIFSYTAIVGDSFHYVDEPGFTLLGKVQVDVTAEGVDVLSLSFSFGETEIFVEAKNITTGKVECTTVDFL